MQNTPPVARVLTELGISHHVFKHVGPISSLEQAAHERGQTPNQVVRSLLFRISDGNFVMVLMPGPRQVAWPRLRTYLGQSRLTMASEDEVLLVTGYRVGAVAPIGLSQPLRILADETIFTVDEISIGSGERGLAVILKSADLVKAIGKVEIGQFAEM